MPSEIKAQDTTSLASIKTVNEAATQSRTLLAEMQQAAQAAGTTLNGIYQDAADAQTAAESAQNSADSALVSLATVEDVVGVLTWISEHGTMTSQAGGTFVDGQVYFVLDPAGDYVINNTHYSIVSEPVAEDIDDYYVLTIDESVQNYVATHIVVDTEGLWIIPDAGGTKILIATGSGSTYTTAGTYIIGKVNGTDTIFAKFLESGATIQAENGTQIAHLGYGNSYSGSEVKSPYYTLGIRESSFPTYDSTKRYRVGQTITNPSNKCAVCKKDTPNPAGAYNATYWDSIYNSIGSYSVSEGVNSIAGNQCSHAEGEARALGIYSHAEGYTNKRDSDGNKIQYPVALAAGSHVEGVSTFASGSGSHAEGNGTSATAQAAHAEGNGTIASGNQAHAEGFATEASGNYSHSQNYWTTAASAYQTAIGKHNVVDNTDTYALIIGNGSSGNAKANALTVDWAGDVQMALDTTAQSGDDYDIYTALVALGWDNDVIV